jgi:outer membrane protein TolC
MTTRTVGISQSVLSPGKRRAERALGAANAALAASHQASTTLEVRRQVADAWIVAWGAHEEVAMLQQLRAAWAQDAAAAEARLKGGTGSAADVLATRVETLDLANRIDALAGEESAARARLARWLDGPAEQPLGKAPDFAGAPVDKEALLLRLDHQGPLLSWSAREQAAEAALDSARADRLPQWAVGVAYGSRVHGLSDLVSVQLSVSLPLFPHDRQDRGIAARAADLAAVRAEHEDARLQQVGQVQSDWAAWLALGQQVRRLRDQVLPMSRDRSTLALAAYRAGGDLQPLVQARRDELTRHAEYARMRADQGRAWAALAYLLPEEDMP